MTEFGNKTGLMQIPKIQTYPDCLLNVRRNLAKSRWTYFKFSFLSLFFLARIGAASFLCVKTHYEVPK